MKYYHVTPTCNMKSIKQIGLRRRHGVVFLWDSKEHALEFAAGAYPDDDLSLFEVNLDSNRVRIDDAYTDGIDCAYTHAVCTFTDIPPSKIHSLGRIRRGCQRG